MLHKTCDIAYNMFGFVCKKYIKLKQELTHTWKQSINRNELHSEATVRHASLHTITALYFIYANTSTHQNKSHVHTHIASNQWWSWRRFDKQAAIFEVEAKKNRDWSQQRWEEWKSVAEEEKGWRDLLWKKESNDCEKMMRWFLKSNEIIT